MRSKNGTTGCMCPRRPLSATDYLFIKRWQAEGTPLRQIAKVILRDYQYLWGQMKRWDKVPFKEIELMDTMTKAKMPYRHYKRIKGGGESESF